MAEPATPPSPPRPRQRSGILSVLLKTPVTPLWLDALIVAVFAPLFAVYGIVRDGYAQIALRELEQYWSLGNITFMGVLFIFMYAPTFFIETDKTKRQWVLIAMLFVFLGCCGMPRIYSVLGDG